MPNGVVAVSPWTIGGFVDSEVFDHTSVIRTLCERWSLPGLTDRDAAAPTFDHVLTLPGSEARLETPAFQPRTYTPLTAAQAHESLLSGMQKGLGHLIAHGLGRVLPAGITRVGELLRHLDGR